MQIMDSADFIEALMDLDNNPDQGIVIDEEQYGHYVDKGGSVYDLEGRYVGRITDEVLAYRTSPARDH